MISALDIYRNNKKIIDESELIKDINCEKCKQNFHKTTFLCATGFFCFFIVILFIKLLLFLRTNIDDKWQKLRFFRNTKKISLDRK